MGRRGGLLQEYKRTTMQNMTTSDLPDDSGSESRPPGDPCIMIIFGASGDLTKRKLIPALYNLAKEKLRIEALIPAELPQYISPNNEVLQLHYPVKEYPKKVTSISLDKQSEISSTLIGIRAQYLIFEGGNVINIRKHSGYEVELSA